jgi:thymidylate synthase
MYNVTGTTLSGALALALNELALHGERIPAPAWDKPGEKNYRQELALSYTSTNPTELSGISLAFTDTPEGLERYIDELVYGSNDYLVAEGKRPYEYHDRFAGQLNGIVDELTRNPWSTRAVACVRRAEDILLEEPPCLTSMTFQLRRGKLSMFVHFRSNDAWNAAHENDIALAELGKNLAKQLNTELGQYTKMCESFHVYARDFKRLESFAERFRSGAATELDAELFNLSDTSDD